MSIAYSLVFSNDPQIIELWIDGMEEHFEALGLYESASAVQLHNQPEVMEPLEAPMNTSPSVFSRKVFVGGLPTECSDLELHRVFGHFGNFVVNRDIRSTHYCFLVFEKPNAVDHLLRWTERVGTSNFAYITVGLRQFKVEIRPFALCDASFVVEPLWVRFIRLSIFVGGIPRTVTAPELANIISKKFGRVLHCSLELEYPNKYPKGAGRVIFRHMRSYIEASQMGRATLTFGEETRSVEIKPYVYRGIACEYCEVSQDCSFCPTCLHYYCTACWPTVHFMANPPHQPLICSPRNLPRSTQSPLF
ncbi:Cytoplasmic polyadenylation element binding protein 3 [Aphelenchoides besseyi]|nr:Cytoplasmic polyadenylation element binding protein 3 [Aphelenchoides besseyi]